MNPAAAQTNITDVSTVGDEIASGLNSVAAVLNRSKECLTLAEKERLLHELHELRVQNSLDEQRLIGMSSANIDQIYGGWVRARYRLENYKNQIKSRTKEIEGMPPCPPGQAGRPIFGWYIGGQLIKNYAIVLNHEFDKTTGALTSQFKDDGDPIGGGISAGYNFAPWTNAFIGPFASVDWLHQTVNHTFPSGFYLGTTTHWFVNLGAKAGYMVAPGFDIYGLAGLALLNQDLVLNFPLGLSSKNTTTPGFTLGIGAEYQPPSWQLWGNPIALFVQYQHTWYDTAHFDTPPSSPSFNYTFKRDDDTVKFGANIYLAR